MDACPTPYKEGFTKREAKRALRDMASRYRNSKKSQAALEAYPCVCGMIHLAGKRRQKGRML